MLKSSIRLPVSLMPLPPLTPDDGFGSGGGAFAITLNKQPVTLSGLHITIKKVS